MQLSFLEINRRLFKYICFVCCLIVVVLYLTIEQNKSPAPDSQTKIGNIESRIEHLVVEKDVGEDIFTESVKFKLQDFKAQVEKLEKKVAFLEGKIPQKHPTVPYLGQKMKRILITGGAGFIGSHLVDVLMTQGHQIIVVDNFGSGRKRNIEQWFGHRNLEIIHHDVCNPLYIEVDEIYHLASPTTPHYYLQNPVKTVKTNVLGTINMLGLAKRLRAKILIASSSDVYGEPMIYPQPEIYWGHVNPIGPRSCYDESKRIAEALAYTYLDTEKVTVKVARIFGTYGPRMPVPDARIISTFIMEALQNKTITVYNNGKLVRSFCYVTDVVKGLVSLMESTYDQSPVNIGSPDHHTVEEFAAMIKKLIPDCQTNMSEEAAVDDDLRWHFPDIAIAKEHLDWTPEVSLQDGLRKTIAYIKEEFFKTSDNDEMYADVKVNHNSKGSSPAHCNLTTF